MNFRNLNIRIITFHCKFYFISYPELRLISFFYICNTQMKLMTTVETVLNKIKTYRKDKGYSQEYMAFKLDISQAAYTNLENQTSKLSVERLIQIAEILGQPLSGFFGEQNNLNKENAVEIHNEIKILINELVKSKDAQINIFKKLLDK